jgi:RNA polymerase nonessential primary-like sigma factor
LTVECEDFLDVEFFELVEDLNLNEKEKVAGRVLMAGGTKGDVAEVLKCTPATATYYFRNLKKKFNFLQYAI